LSATPPGGNGTINVIGRTGKSCAAAGPGVDTATTVTNAHTSADAHRGHQLISHGKRNDM